MPSTRREEVDRESELRRVTEDAVSEWFDATDRRSKLGIPNAGLAVLEHFRERAPLRNEDYLSKGGSQVRGLNGASAIRLIRRYLPTAPSIGTESGRTSRGTPSAATALVARLNEIAGTYALSAQDRAIVADEGQRWIVENPIRAYFSRQRVTPELSPQWSAARNVSSILEAAGDRRGVVAQHLVGAKLVLRFPDLEITNLPASAADVQTGRGGDFEIGDAIIHVTVAPSSPLLEKCAGNVQDGFRVTLIVVEEVRNAAREMIRQAGLDQQVDVTSVESFVGQNLDELSDFTNDGARTYLRQLIETYNSRVTESETDASLQIRLPRKL